MGTGRGGERHHDFGEVVKRNVRQLGTVVLWDDELARNEISRADRGAESEAGRTAWPLERGWMSRKASVFADSKSFMDGMSPVDRYGVSPTW